MRMRNILTNSLAAVALIAASYGPAAASPDGIAADNPHARPVIYVTSQNLYYDSIITANPLPPRGRFQLLEMGPNGLQTEFGKGDRGYVGGRWAEDFDGDGVFHYFACPLLGKGRSNP
jgi:hypothetical protein